MGKRDDSPSGGRRIDDEAMGVFITAIRRGAALEDAARAAGFTLGGFWKLRKRDPAFDEAVEEALELSNTPRFISPGNGRRFQVRRIRRLRFVPWRKEVFLANFAATCDETQAADAAGVSTSTICRHRQRDPDFAAGYEAALEHAYPRLEAEALRQRLEAQRRFREEVIPVGEVSREFERVLKLLDRWQRGNGRVGARKVRPGRMQRWSFDDAIELLERKLRNMDVPIPPPVPEDEP